MSSDEQSCSRTSAPVVKNGRNCSSAIKDFFGKIKNRMQTSGSLTDEDSNILCQLETMFIDNYSKNASPRRRSSDDNSDSHQSQNLNNSFADNSLQSTSGYFGRGFSERTQRLVDMSKIVRRGSDASLSGKSCSVNDLSLKNKSERKEHRKRLLDRKRKLECRKSVDISEIVAEDDATLKMRVKELYENVIISKPPMEAYQSFLNSLRQYFARQTWADCVETVMKQFLCQNVLLEASKLAEKYIKEYPDIPLLQKVDEYKFQVFIHLFACPPCNIDSEPTPPYVEIIMETVTSLLRMIDFMTDHQVLLEFLNEDVLESFIETLPRQLAHLYDELGQPIPPELSAYANEECKEESFFTPHVIPSPRKAVTVKTVVEDINEDSNQSATSQNAASSRTLKRSQSWFDNKHHKMIKVPSSGAKKMKLGKKKKDDDHVPIVSSSLPCAVVKEEKDTDSLIKNGIVVQIKKSKNFRRSLTFSVKSSSNSTQKSSTNYLRSPKGRFRGTNLIPDTPAFHQIPGSEKRKRKMKKIVSQQRSKEIVNETPHKLWAKKIPVRQSPRHHASTRALYSCAPSLLSELLQQQTEEDNMTLIKLSQKKGNLHHAGMVPSPLVSPGSPKFILVKSKKGNVYSVKKSSCRKSAVAATQGVISATPFSDDSKITKEKTPAKTPVIGRLGREKSTPGNNHNHNAATNVVSFVTPRKKTKKNLSKTFDDEECKAMMTSQAEPAQKLSTTHVVVVKKQQQTVSSRQTTIPPLKLKLTRASCNASVDATSSASTPLTHNSSASVGVDMGAYQLPTFATEIYRRYMTNIKRERNKPPKPGDDPFYARGTRRNSIFYENSGVGTAASASKKCFDAEHKAATSKNRCGRKMKSSIEYFNLANFLLNVKNKNPSSPAELKNLQRSVSTPIKIMKKLRLMPKNRKRNLKRQSSATNLSSSSSQIDADAAAVATRPLDFRSLHTTPSVGIVGDVAVTTASRLCSTDTDGSEEFGGNSLSPPPPQSHSPSRRASMSIVKTEHIDASSYNLRVKKFSPDACVKTTDASATQTPTRRNIFDWAAADAAHLEEDVFLTLPHAQTHASLRRPSRHCASKFQSLNEDTLCADDLFELSRECVGGASTPKNGVVASATALSSASKLFSHEKSLASANGLVKLATSPLLYNGMTPRRATASAGTGLSH